MNKFNHATRIIEGFGTIDCVGTEAKALGATKVLVVTDSFLSTTELFKRILSKLEEEQLSYIVYDNVKPNPPTTDCDALVELARKESVDLLIAYGGGSAMDEAKAVGALVTNGGKCVDWDYKEFPKKMLPLITIPTTAGTGSEVTFVAVITDEEREYKMSLMDEKNLVPTLAICDPQVTLALPKSLTAACGIDALTHAIEAYTVKCSSPMTDAIALYAMELIAKSIRTAYEDGSDKDARENMMIGSTMAGMAFINSNVGAVHAIAETIGAKYGIAHGVANSLFLPYVMEYNIPAEPYRYSVVAERLGVERTPEMSNEDHAYAGVQFIKKLNRDLQIPCFKDLKGIDPEEFDLIAEKSAKNPLSIDNARTIEKADYLEILKKAYSNE